MQWKSHISSNVALKVFFRTSSLKRLKVVYPPSILDCIKMDTSIGKGNFPFFNRFWDNKLLSKKVPLNSWGHRVKAGKVTLLGIRETKKVVCSESKSFNPKKERTKKANNRHRWVNFLKMVGVFTLEQLFEQPGIFKRKQLVY